MRKGNQIPRLMTPQEIEFCTYLKNVKVPDWSGDRYSLKALLKHLAANPPTIIDSRIPTLYRMLLKYRTQLPKITNRHPIQFWTIVRNSLAEAVRKKPKPKTLCQVFAEEEKKKPSEKLNVEKLFDQFHEVKKERERLGIPEITNL